jgi:hypothetical protein
MNVKEFKNFRVVYNPDLEEPIQLFLDDFIASWDRVNVALGEIAFFARADFTELDDLACWLYEKEV